MSVAILSAKRSKDPSTQQGACIVNKDKRIVAVGYNAFPKGCCDNEFPGTKDVENGLLLKEIYGNTYFLKFFSITIKIINFLKNINPK